MRVGETVQAVTFATNCLLYRKKLMEKSQYFKVEAKASDFAGLPETEMEEGISAGHGAEE